MRLKSCKKYIGYIVIISCLSFLCIGCTGKNNVEEKSRFIIKSSRDTQNINKEGRNDGGEVRVSAPKGESEVQPLPVPDTDATITINLLQ